MKQIRFGLCCLFISEPIRFKTIRYSYLSQFPRQEQLRKIDSAILENLSSLARALQFCHENAIGCFRITSTLFPLYTHPAAKYTIDDLPSKEEIYKRCSLNKEFAAYHDLRLTFHPDQFIVLNSPTPSVVTNAMNDLVYHAEISDLLGVDVITLHAGGVYGNKKTALQQFEKGYALLPQSVTTKLALENDDKCYTPEDLLPLCKKLHIPLVYDVHHHRCNPDTLTVDEASIRAYETWDREPLFHISSAKNLSPEAKKAPHADFIRQEDVPPLWKELVPLTVEVEAKAKERAVLELMKTLYC